VIRFGVVLSVAIIAVGLLVAGVIDGSLLIVVISIGAAALATLLLAVAVLVWRHEIFGQVPAEVAAGPDAVDDGDVSGISHHTVQRVISAGSGAATGPGPDRPAGSVGLTAAPAQMAAEATPQQPASGQSAEAGWRRPRFTGVVSGNPVSADTAASSAESASAESRSAAASVGPVASASVGAAAVGPTPKLAPPRSVRSDETPPKPVPPKPVPPKAGTADDTGTKPSAAADSGPDRADATDSVPAGTVPARSEAASVDPAPAASRSEHAGSAQVAGSGTSGGGSSGGGSSGGGVAVGATSGLAGQPDSVRVVPGIARYHRKECLLIRFLSEADLEVMSRQDATADGCVPCRACQPDQAAADVSVS
jgi:uncharacterized membrane protein YgcG